MNLNPLERRTFKVKNPTVSFYCALCRTPRALTTSFRLTTMNYLQISLLTFATTALTYEIMSFRGIFSFFVYLAAFEFVRRVNYRKELPCPHCGFDASWYRKDVKVARKLVAEYWSKRGALEKAPKVPDELVSAQSEEYNASTFGSGY